MFENTFATMTQAERDEYNAYLDDCKTQVRDPLPEDFPFDDDTPSVKLPDDGSWDAAQQAYDRFKDEPTQVTRLYDDADVWEVTGYGRVWCDREGNYRHNGPKVRFLNIARERFEDAVTDLIQAVHTERDHEHALQWKEDALRGHYGGWR